MKLVHRELAQVDEHTSIEAFVDIAKDIDGTADQAGFIASLGKIDKASDVLDLWCGSGALSFAISKLAGSVTATDYSEKLIDKAKAMFLGVEFRKSDPVMIACPDAMFDVVVSNSSIHHYQQPTENIREAYRVLKPGGRMVVTMPIQAHRVGLTLALEAVERHMAGASAAFSGGPLLYVDDPAPVEELMLRAGFARCTGGVYGSFSIVSTMAGLVDLVVDKSGNGAAPSDLRTVIYADAAEMAQAYYCREKQHYIFPLKIIAVSGQK